MNSKIKVFGSLAIFDEELSEKEFENAIFISPGGIVQSEAGVFRKEYQKTYGTNPDIIAELAYDGMNLLIQVTGTAGTERENIQKAMLKIKSEGITGSIKFDEKGNRIGSPAMFQFKNGEPVPVEK
jgi:ABC-type branched-subunit amino acid transport system substrate-binding protein